MIEPPAERKYAVEPVGVATQMPSAAMRVDRSVVDAQPERNDARDLALAHDHVVEREVPAVAVLGLQRGALLDEEPALDRVGQIVEPGIVLVELGEEAQTSGVDAEERHVVLDRDARARAAAFRRRRP